MVGGGGLLDLDDLLDSLRGDPVSGGGTGISSDDNAALESKSKGCSSMGNFYWAIRVGMVVCCSTEECSGLGNISISNYLSINNTLGEQRNICVPVRWEAART